MGRGGRECCSGELNTGKRGEMTAALVDGKRIAQVMVRGGRECCCDMVDESVWFTQVDVVLDQRETLTKTGHKHSVRD
jgi:hypothetical protein